VQTDRIIPSNNLDIINRENEEACMLKDTAISGDRIISKKDTKKILKYKDRKIEIQCKWNVKAK